MGTLHRRNGFYTVQTVFSIALHLSLPLTGNILLFQIFNTLHSLWFISLFPDGDQKNVPTRSKFTGITILVETFGPHNVMSTRYTHVTYTHTHTHTHTPLTLKTWISSSRSSVLLQLPLGTEITFSTEPTSAERHREALTRATASKDSLGFHQCSVNIIPVPMNITS